MSLPLKTTRYFAFVRLSIQDVSHGPDDFSARASPLSSAIVAAARVRLVMNSRRLGIGRGVRVPRRSDREGMKSRKAPVYGVRGPSIVIPPCSSVTFVAVPP